MMLIHGLRVLSASDTVYEISDSRRMLGGIVRVLVPAQDGKGAVWKFCGLRGQHNLFDKLSDAVKDFAALRNVHPFDAVGDAPQPEAVAKSLR